MSWNVSRPVKARLPKLTVCLKYECTCTKVSYVLVFMSFSVCVLRISLILKSSLHRVRCPWTYVFAFDTHVSTGMKECWVGGDNIATKT